MNPVCIIGAGPAGLSAAVALQERGLPFRILEAGSGIGGIWDMERPDTPMYETAHFISSRTLSGFRDFPMPDDFPDYPRHDQVLAYIREYARHHDLERHVTFGTTVERVRPATGPEDAQVSVAGTATRLGADGLEEDPRQDVQWAVEWSGGSGTFSAVVAATGVTWHPNVPDIPGEFTGEIRHSSTYRSPDEFRGRRVLVVGGGNSGVDIACDAATAADRALISLRRGYHFLPKWVFGIPADVFAHRGPRLPSWLERRVFGFLVDRVLVGDLTRYGLPEPDHPILASHPIMNTQILHHLGHGDLHARPDVERFDGGDVVFVDGSREEVDLVLLATGYRRRFPFLELPPPRDDQPRPPGNRHHSGPADESPGPGPEMAPDDLWLMLFHRRFPTLVLMGVFETDGAAYDLFGVQARLAARVLDPLVAPGVKADRIRAMARESRPDLHGGRTYVDSLRHDFYVSHEAYRKALRQVGRALD